jgi:uroporphyrinogen-III synthase
MVTRPKPQGEILCGQIRAAGGHAIHFPTIEIHPPKNLAVFAKGIVSLYQYDWVVFISPQAVYWSAPAIHEQWPQFPPGVEVAALGGGTADALRQAGLPVDIYPKDDWRTEGLLDDASFQELAGKKIALICGEGGRDLLEKTLTARGAQVTRVIVYERCIPKVNVNEYIKLLQTRQIDIILCTSGEILHNLKLLLQYAWTELRKIPVVVISERMQILARQLEFENILEARNASFDAIMDILRGYLCRKERMK